jgi:GT2 family glycosyltransferase
VNEGVVSVVVVNYRGADDTLACLRTLRDELDWPAEALELICVDNASDDGSAQRIAAAVPQARLIRSATNTGFAGGCNLRSQPRHRRDRRLSQQRRPAAPQLAGRRGRGAPP